MANCTLDYLKPWHFYFSSSHLFWDVLCALFRVLFPILLLNNNKEKITIQILIQGLKKNELKEKYKFVFIDNKNHTIKYFNLINVFNKIIDITI